MPKFDQAYEQLKAIGFVSNSVEEDLEDHQGEKLLVDAKGEETQNEEVEEKLVDDTVNQGEEMLCLDDLDDIQAKVIQGEAKPAAKVWNDEEIGGDEKENDVSGAEINYEAAGLLKHWEGGETTGDVATNQGKKLQSKETWTGEAVEAAMIFLNIELLHQTTREGTNVEEVQDKKKDDPSGCSKDRMVNQDSMTDMNDPLVEGTRKSVETESSRGLVVKEIEVKQGKDAVALPKESNKIGSDAALYECCYMEETATELIEVESNITKDFNVRGIDAALYESYYMEHSETDLSGEDLDVMKGSEKKGIVNEFSNDGLMDAVDPTLAIENVIDEQINTDDEYFKSLGDLDDLSDQDIESFGQCDVVNGADANGSNFGMQDSDIASRSTAASIKAGASTIEPHKAGDNAIASKVKKRRQDAAAIETDTSSSLSDMHNSDKARDLSAAAGFNVSRTRMAKADSIARQVRKRRLEAESCNDSSRYEDKLVSSHDTEITSHAAGGRDALENAKGRQPVEIAKKSKSRCALELQGWKSVRGADCYTSKLLKVSPGRKLRFISTQAAEEFDALRQKCNGDECQASVLYEKRIKRTGGNAARLLVGGFGSLSIDTNRKANDRQRHQALREQKWTIERDARNNPLKVSPGRGLKFISLRAAEEFEKIRQENDLDEYTSSDIFIKRMKEQSRAIAEMVVGGIGSLSMCPWSHNSHQHRHDTLIEHQWKIEREERNGYTEVRKVSPSGIPFVCTNAAEDFEELRQKCNGDECKASELFLKKFRGYKIAGLVKGGIRALSSVACGSINDERRARDNDDDCYICDQGGELVCCDYCSKSYHLQCHIPRLEPDELPEKWKCCECLAPEMEFMSCGDCEDCLVAKPCSNMRRAHPESKPKSSGNQSSPSTIVDTKESASPVIRNAHFHRRKLLPGWGTSRGKSNELLRVSPGRGLKFIYLYAAEEFEKIRQENNLDEFRSSDIFMMRMKEQDREIAKLVVGGISALSTRSCKTNTNEPNPSFKSSECQQPEATSTQAIRSSSNETVTLLEEHKIRASRCLAELSRGWNAVSYQSKSKNELHFQSPSQSFVFKSFKGALLFDEMLKNHSDESAAIEAFIEEHGSDRVRGMVYNFNSGVCRLSKFQSQMHGAKSPGKLAQQTQVSQNLNTNDLENNDDLGDGYWEIDQVLRVRFEHGRMQCLVRWRANSNDTWEPSDHLCDTAIEQAFEILSGDSEYKQLLKKTLVGIEAAVRDNDTEKVFYYPVTDDIAPGYSSVIKEPMCLSLIREKVLNCKYRDLEGFKNDVALMFANCIKYNDSSTNFYRVEAIRQRKLFLKLYGKAASQFEMGMERSEQSNSSVKSVKKTTKSSKIKTGLTSAASKKKTSRSLSRKSSTKKRKQSSNKHTGESVKKCKIGPCCEEVDIPQCGFIPSSPANEVDGQLISTFEHVNDEEKKCQVSLFHKHFPDLIRSDRYSRNRFSDIKRSFINAKGDKFELLSCEVVEKSGYRQKQRVAEVLYIKTAENGVSKLKLQLELEKLCCFGTLDNEKVVSRLGMLQTAGKHILTISSSHIKIVEEGGEDGCGYVPRDFFCNFNLNECPYKNADAMQIRIIGPRVGLIKGMLVVKSGIDRIIIPKSMVKAKSSQVSTDDFAYVIFKSMSSPSKPCKAFGKYLDPEEVAADSFVKQSQTKFSDMYVRMLVGLGLSPQQCNGYVKDSLKLPGLRHCSFMGVADPTGSIPYGMIFIPGYAKHPVRGRDLFARCLAHEKVFVARSPCLLPTDAKILKVLQQKPDGMSRQHWDMLCGFKFGMIIFGLPKTENDVPVPSMIADGDLDGDRYFVLWDEQLLQSMLHPKTELGKKALRDLETLSKAKTNSQVNRSPSLDKPYRSDWLSAAQDDMLGAEKLCLAKELVGVLYNLAFESSKRDNGHWDIYDEDAIAFAKAYTDAMDSQKHGGKIYLPGHLHDQVKKKYWQCLTSD